MEEPQSLIPFGHAFKDHHFNFAKDYTPLNHGSFGTFPTAVRDYQRELQDATDSRPDSFLRYTYPELLLDSRAAIAPLLGCPVDEVVFVPNATTGVNTILRNFNLTKKGDVIVYFNTIYKACEKTIQFLCETTLVEGAYIVITYPIKDDDIISKFIGAAKQLKEDGKNVKVAMFDTVLAFPGVRFPWEKLVKACKDRGILSLIDGAHGVGHIDLTYLGEIGPDFFTSNCYKWLYSPRGSFGELFKKVSTIDPTPYACVTRALEFRELVCGGEAKIREYCENIVNTGGRRMVEILGTEVMDNKEKTLYRCCFVNVRLPIVGTPDIASHDNIPSESKREEAGNGVGYIMESDVEKIAAWMTERSVKRYETMIPIRFYAGQIWCRISGQIYLELGDFEWATNRLKRMCEEVATGDFRDAA